MGFIDTHLHLSGCISPQFVWEVIDTRGLTFLASSLSDVVAQMTFADGEPKTFNRFLNKFKILDELPWDEEILDGAIKDASKILLQNQVDYAFIDFSINKYMKIGWHKHEAIKFIHSAFNRYAPGRVGLVFAVKYESPKAGQSQYLNIIERSDVSDLLVGVDLVGDEAYYDAAYYASLLKAWRSAGKMVRAHVGESQSHDNIRSAIEQVGVTNVAHGIKILSDPDLIYLSKDLGIVYDMCISSNYQTGVLSSEIHPLITMMLWGIKCTLGSDDPVQFNCTLRSEFELAKTIGLTADHIKTLQMNAAELVNRFSDG